MNSANQFECIDCLSNTFMEIFHFSSQLIIFSPSFAICHQSHWPYRAVRVLMNWMSYPNEEHQWNKVYRYFKNMQSNAMSG